MLASGQVRADVWDLPRPQLEIDDQIAQAETVRERVTRGLFVDQPRRRPAAERLPEPNTQPRATPANTTQPVPSAVARAHEPDAFAGRIYIAGAASVGWVEDADLGSTNSAANAFLRSLNSEVTFDTGHGALGAVGWRFLPVEDIGPRIELELSYQQNDIDSFRVLNTDVAGLDGDASTLALMGNLVVDIYTGTEWLPYVGIGAGLASFDAEVSAGGTSESEDDTVLTGQAIAGVAYALTDTTFLTLDYRFLMLDEVELSGGTLKPRLHKASFGVRHQF